MHWYGGICLSLVVTFSFRLFLCLWIGLWQRFNICKKNTIIFKNYLQRFQLIVNQTCTWLLDTLGTDFSHASDKCFNLQSLLVQIIQPHQHLVNFNKCVSFKCIFYWELNSMVKTVWPATMEMILSLMYLHHDVHLY